MFHEELLLSILMIHPVKKRGYISMTKKLLSLVLALVAVVSLQLAVVPEAFAAKRDIPDIFSVNAKKDIPDIFSVDAKKDIPDIFSVN